MALQLRKVDASKLTNPNTSAYDAHNASTAIVNGIRCALYKVIPVVFGDMRVLANTSICVPEELTDRITMIPVVQSSLPADLEDLSWKLHAGNPSRNQPPVDVTAGMIRFLRGGKEQANHGIEFEKNYVIASIRDRQEIHITGRLVRPTEQSGLHTTTIRPRFHTYGSQTTRFHEASYPLHRLEFEPKAHMSADENLRMAIKFLKERLESLLDSSKSIEFTTGEHQTQIIIRDFPVYVAEMINSDLISRGLHSSCYQANPDADITMRVVPGPGNKKTGQDLFLESVRFLVKYLEGEQK